MKKQFRITLNGKTYEVVAELLDEPAAPSAPTASRASARAANPQAATSLPKPAPTAASVGEGAILSPLAGKVVSVDVGVGDAVKPGQTVITLEAMKMNTVVSARVEGMVSSIKVKAGDAVEEGQVLLMLT